MSVYNGERFLHQAIDSILTQSYGDFEFIIIDDGSEDESATIIEKFRILDSRVVFLRQENRGLVESLNRGCSLARGTYIARMDADDVALKDRLELQVSFLIDHRDIGLLGGAVHVIDINGKILRTTSNPTGDAEIRTALLNECPFWHPTVMIRKDTLEAAGGYRKVVVHAEDYDLWLRVAELGKMANLEAVLLAYRLHSNQVTTQQCRQMVLSTLVARSAATRRNENQPDPLNSVESITPSLLAELAINPADLETALAARFVYVIRNMCNSGEYAAASNIVSEMCSSSEWRHACRRVMADFHLLAAKLYWRQRRIGASLSSVADAVFARPLILGRPLAPLVNWYGARNVGAQHTQK